MNPIIPNSNFISSACGAGSNATGFLAQAKALLQSRNVAGALDNLSWAERFVPNVPENWVQADILTDIAELYRQIGNLEGVRRASWSAKVVALKMPKYDRNENYMEVARIQALANEILELNNTMLEAKHLAITLKDPFHRANILSMIAEVEIDIGGIFSARMTILKAKELRKLYFSASIGQAHTFLEFAEIQMKARDKEGARVTLQEVRAMIPHITDADANDLNYIFSILNNLLAQDTPSLDDLTGLLKSLKL